MAKKLVFNPLLKKGFQNESREDLAETLVIGNITGGTDIVMTAGDTLDSSSGGSQLDLNYGGDSTLLLSTDSGAFAGGHFYSTEVGTPQVQVGYNTAYISFFDGEMVAAQASIISVLGNAAVIRNTNATRSALFLNSGSNLTKSSFASTIEHTVIVVGVGISAKTANTAYVNQMSFQESGVLFDTLIVPSTATADRTATLQDASGTIAYLSDITGGAVVQTGQTTNNVQLTLGGSQAIAVQSVQSFVTRVTAIQSLAPSAGTIGDIWVHEFRGAIKNIAGTPALVDTVIDEYIAEDAAMTGVSVAIVAGASTLDIKVTGETGKEIEWKAETIFSEIIYV